jgi:hypothetical protein
MPVSRFATSGRSARFWAATWTLAVAAEFDALAPIIFAGDARSREPTSSIAATRWKPGIARRLSAL